LIEPLHVNTITIIMAPNAGAKNTEEAIPVQAVAMKLMDVRLKPASAIITSVTGEFTAAGRHEIVFLRAGGTLEVQRIVQTEDDEEDQRTFLKLIARVETRSILRSCSVIRFTGEKRDVLAVGGDGGALSVLDFENGVCKIIHCTTFGKTGCRRSTPGQYLAADPKGRAVMVSAIEKRKLVYVLNRDATGTPTIASPLEAHRTRTLTFDTVGLDNGYDNPIFATLELQYPDTEDSAPEPLDEVEKQLAYYELDLGLNHVSRRWATTTHRTACCLAAIPGGVDGPGGVLVGGEDWIEYMHETIGRSDDDDMDTDKKFTRVVAAIPRRKLHPNEKGILITKITLHRQKKSKFFALAQNELGDVYKVTLQVDSADKTKVTSMEVALLDSLPVANSLNVSKLGMLFAAAEFGDHNLYQFERIDLPDATTSSSEETQKAFLESEEKNETSFLTTANATKLARSFDPTVLKNLRKIFTMDNPSPTTNIMVGELAGNEVSPQIYTLTGSGPQSAIRILRHGASVTELAVSDLPGIPGGIFTIADNSAEAAVAGVRNDQYIVVSFADATLVLSVGETVEEVGKESGFLTNAPTLACSALGNDGALCQVHPSGVRQIQKGQAKQWHCPGLKRIECASANESQVIIALAGGEVIYFELDPMSGNLTEKTTSDMGADVCCLDVGTIPNGRSRSLFAVVGCRDQTVRVVSLEPGNLLSQRSSTALKSRPHSVALQMMTNSDNATGNSDLTLVIGLDDGSSLRASVDPVTGSIGTSPTRRFLGARPVSVSRISLESSSAALLLSSRPWISRRDGASGKHIMAPLSYAPLDHGCSFSSDAVREGVVATAGKTLRILSVDSVGVDGGDDEAFNTNKVDLRYTPRQMTLMSTTTNTEERKVVLAVVESDYNDYSLEEKTGMGFDSTGEGKVGKKGAGKGEGDAMDMDEGSDDEGVTKEMNDEEEDGEDAEEKEARRTPIRGPIPPGPGHWGSCVRLLDPSNACATLDCLEMGRNEAALCCTSVRFHSKGGEPLLAVGTVTGMTLHPLKYTSSHIVLYRIVNGDRLQLLHRTAAVDDGPVFALAHFQGRLLVGIGKTLRLYEMGKRQLLRKCELRGLPTYVKAIQTVGDRAFVGDMMQSIQIVKYDAASNRLGLIASDPSPRPIVCQELLDLNTVAVGDKFGNISVLRLPRSADTGAIDFSGQRALWDASRDDATPRLELLCQYYVGEVVTSMSRSSLVAGGAESLIYVTVSGRIGALVPFTSREDVEFFSQLEASLRTDAPRPTGRDPQSYRSYYAPAIHVVDGELCDAFNSLSHEEKSKIAEGLDRTVGEIMKKLEDTRNALL
jgi:splicing factor 3B subunit 3